MNVLLHIVWRAESLCESKFLLHKPSLDFSLVLTGFVRRLWKPSAIYEQQSSRADYGP